MSADVGQPEPGAVLDEAAQARRTGHGVDRAVDEGHVAATTAGQMVEGQPDAGRRVGAHVVDGEVWGERADDDDRLADRREGVEQLVGDT